MTGDIDQLEGSEYDAVVALYNKLQALGDEEAVKTALRNAIVAAKLKEIHEEAYIIAEAIMTRIANQQ